MDGKGSDTSSIDTHRGGGAQASVRNRSTFVTNAAKAALDKQFVFNELKHKQPRKISK